MVQRQVTGAGKVTVCLPWGFSTVPFVRLPEVVGEEPITAVCCNGRTFFPARIRNGDHPLEFLQKSLAEVLGQRNDPIVVVREARSSAEDQEEDPTAVFFAPGPESRPLTLGDLHLGAT